MISCSKLIRKNKVQHTLFFITNDYIKRYSIRRFDGRAKPDRGSINGDEPLILSCFLNVDSQIIKCMSFIVQFHNML
jgi:hypothetical protein